MFLRKIGKLLRGKATPFQILSATILGGLMGSLPGFGQSPLLVVILLFLLIVLNANLFLAALSLIAAKLLYLILLPVYFNVGVTLLEGPLGGIVSKFVNAPVTAWFGLDYYVVVPGLMVGLLFGLVTGVGLSRMLKGFRRKMANLESGSDKFQAYTSKFWVKALAWLFVGGIKGKKSWEEMSDMKGGLMVRPIGIIFVLSLVVLGFIAFKLLDETIVTSNVRERLELANTATVDLGSVEILPVDNRIVLSGLAMANPEDLQKNRFASTEIVADISGANLLAKKVVIDSLQIRQPEAGTARKVPGVRTADLPPPPAEAPVPADGDIVDINSYLENATVWRERFAMVKRLYDRIAPSLKSDGEDAAEETVDGPGWREQLAQRALELGYGMVRSSSLIEDAPSIWIRELVSDNLAIDGSDERYIIRGENLSTQPGLLDVPGMITVAQESGTLEMSLTLPSSESPARSVVAFSYTGLAVSDLEAMIGKKLPMEGGTIDIVGEGAIDNAILDVPLQVTMRNTTLNAFGQTLPLDEFPLQVRILGPLDNPRIDIPKDAIESAIQKGGQKAIEDMIQKEGGEEIKKLFNFKG